MWVKGELLDDFVAAREIARGELDRSNQTHLFDRLDWFERVWAHCPPGKAPLIARARAENTDAWLFLARTDETTAVSLGSWYTLAFRPVFSGESDEKVRAAQLVALARRLATGLSTIILEPVPNSDDTANLILSAFRRAGWIGVMNPKTGSWTADVAGKSFAEFWAERPGEVRSTRDRKLKKFDVKTKVYTRFDVAAWASYEAIYGESWKEHEGSPAFLKAMAQTEGSAGTLRLGIASFEGEAVAAQLWTVENGRALIHKLAYREDKAELSAGTILSAALFKHAIDIDHVSIIDYGTGDDRYKQSWMNSREQLYTLELYNPKTLAGIIGAAKSWLSTLVRRGS
jgi:Acetyltransferase (GNAT) domain